MPNVKCEIEEGDETGEFDESLIERVKNASSPPNSRYASNFSIHIEYSDEDGHNEIDDDLDDVTSWDDTDKIACIVLTYLMVRMSALKYSTLEDLEVRGKGEVMGFGLRELTAIARDAEKQSEIKKKETKEKQEFERLKAKYGE
jgi:hypothetical protein